MSDQNANPTLPVSGQVPQSDPYRPGGPAAPAEVKAPYFTKVEEAAKASVQQAGGQVVIAALVDERVAEIIKQRTGDARSVRANLIKQQGELNKIRPSQKFINPADGSPVSFYTEDDVKKQTKLKEWIGQADAALRTAIETNTPDAWTKLNKYVTLPGAGGDKSTAAGE